MYGQMTAGSWIYIGSQGIVQGTYECFAEIARRRFDGSLAGTISLTAGLGGMGGAQPLAITMNGGVALCIEIDAAHLRRRIETGYLDEEADDLEDAIARCQAAKTRAPRAQRRACRERGRRAAGAPAHGLRGGHRHRPDERPRSPERLRAQPDVAGGGAAAAGGGPRRVRAPLPRRDRGPLRGDGRLPRRRRRGLRLRQQPPRRGELGGFERAFAYPGFVPAYIRPLFCDGKGPFRWVALSGDPADIAATDRAVLEEIPDDEPLRRWIELAEEKIAYQGLPARICWAGYGERARLGLRFNELVDPARSRRRS